MEKQFSKSGLAAVVATTVLLGACGGGGGGGSSDSGGGDSSSQLQLDPDGYGERQAQIRTQTDYEAAAQAYEDTGKIDQLVSEVESTLGVAGTLSVGDPVVREAATESCENEGGTVDVTTSDSSTRVVFDNCELSTTSIPNLLLDGSYSQDVSGNDTDQTIVIQYSIRGENLDTGGPVSIQGQETARMVQTGSDAGSLTVATDRLEYLLEDDYVALEDTRIAVSVDGDSFVMEMAATLVSSAIDGYLTVSTPVAVAGNINTTCPAEGAVRLEADGSVEVRFGLSTGTGDAVLVTLNDSDSQGFDTCDAGSVWVPENG
ncbi:hypothetical protein ACJO2E_06430 [Marinobacter sp. M1N3S26]|uniref:hypothetical protein n=1 Tax=Marinobacter sp. M1N3S26 TaxID=3382299 RepID=UPI00387AE8CB